MSPFFYIFPVFQSDHKHQRKAHFPAAGRMPKEFTGLHAFKDKIAGDFIVSGKDFVDTHCKSRKSIHMAFFLYDKLLTVQRCIHLRIEFKIRMAEVFHLIIFNFFNQTIKLFNRFDIFLKGSPQNSEKIVR